MKTKRSALSIIILLVLVVYARPLYAVSAEDMVKFLPDKILDFATTDEAPTIEDVQKGGGEYHRVQKIYSSKSKHAVIVTARGKAASKEIARFISQGTSSLSIKGFKGVVLPPENKEIASVCISVKLRDDQYITVVTLNTNSASIAKKLLNTLDLQGLAKQE